MRELDPRDALIVRALAEDGRCSLAELARIAGLSAPSVAERVRRLEDSGVITGYAAQIDPVALGYGLSVYINIRPLPGRLPKVAALLEQIPEIVSCDRITGDDCFIAKAHLHSVADLEAVIDRIIPEAQTNTALIQSAPVPSRLPPLPEIPAYKADRTRSRNG